MSSSSLYAEDFRDIDRLTQADLDATIKDLESAYNDIQLGQEITLHPDTVEQAIKLIRYTKYLKSERIVT